MTQDEIIAPKCPHCHATMYAVKDYQGSILYWDCTC
jgi:hypothetical protein